MQIQIEQGDWGEAMPQDIQRLLDDVSGQLLRHFSDPPAGVIRIQCRPNEPYPRVLYRTSDTDDYVVWLTVRNHLWSKFAYQFAHELCHILSDYERLRVQPNQWFHESLCELASIFTVSQMGVTWQTHPPYENWKDYAISLQQYAEELINRQEHQLPSGVGLGQWLRVHEPDLRADPYLRKLNSLVAIQLLSQFQSEPQHWQCIRSMPNTNESFDRFLEMWHSASPESHQEFIREIAGHFDIDLQATALQTRVTADVRQNQ